MSKYKKQKDGRYRASVRLGYDDNGKPIDKYVSGRTIKEVEEKIMDIKQSVASGLVLNDKTTFGKYADNWLKVYKANRGIATVNMYRNIVDKHFSLINSCTIREVNRMMIQQMVNSESDHPRICEQMVMVLKQIFNSCIKDGLIVKSPCIDIELPRHHSKEKRALTKEEKEKLRCTILTPMERAFLMTLYGTGCRPSEMYALTKKDIDVKNSCIIINKSVQFDGGSPVSISLPKTESSIRNIIVSQSLIKQLVKYSQSLPYDNLFGDQEHEGQILHKYNYEAIFTRILRKAHLSDAGITMYTLRHNYCTECYYRGVSLKECQRQMGHSSYRMILEIYSHLDAEKEGTADKLADMVL